MPAETHRQACDTAHARAMERHAAEIAAGGAAGIGRRVQLETSAALLRGVADLLDAGLPAIEVWVQTGRALAGGLTAFLMTLHAGDREAAAEDLPGALESIYELALVRLSDPAEWPDAPAPGSGPEARH